MFIYLYKFENHEQLLTVEQLCQFVSMKLDLNVFVFVGSVVASASEPKLPGVVHELMVLMPVPGVALNSHFHLYGHTKKKKKIICSSIS